jgi:hypothetical protein
VAVAAIVTTAVSGSHRFAAIPIFVLVRIIHYRCSSVHFSERCHACAAQARLLDNGGKMAEKTALLWLPGSFHLQSSGVLQCLLPGPPKR